MRRSLITLLFTAVAWAHSAAAGAPPVREIDNVAAFARLYGVVRYFYPSDAAAGLDWNRFVVHGVRRVRSAVDARSLEAALKELFLPLGPGIVIGTPCRRLPRRLNPRRTSSPGVTSDRP